MPVRARARGPTKSTWKRIEREGAILLRCSRCGQEIPAAQWWEHVGGKERCDLPRPTYPAPATAATIATMPERLTVPMRRLLREALVAPQIQPLRNGRPDGRWSMVADQLFRLGLVALSYGTDERQVASLTARGADLAKGLPLRRKRTDPASPPTQSS